MRCECSQCTVMFDPERMMHCEDCEGYFCPGCWDEHDTDEGCPFNIVIAVHSLPPVARHPA